eukprot:c30764_g1_i1.p1 GENE.c30764_g1_i1~~c30764_g1_i1.p1  ORF type:complete len:462 (+),score=137.69 c30764_g1_i1:24-1388(+)
MRGREESIALYSQAPSIYSQEEEKVGFLQEFFAFQITLRAIIGTGVMALPYATSQIGWFASTVSLLFIAAVSAHTSRLLILCMRRVRLLHFRANFHENSLNDIEPTQEVKLRDVGFFACGKFGVYISDFMTILCQFWGAISYVSFISKNVADIFGVSCESLWIKAAIFPVLVVLSLVRSTSSLAPLASLGNLLFILALILMIYFGATQTSPSANEFKIADFTYFSNFFGVSIFAFTAHIQIMSIEDFLPKPVQKRYVNILFLAFSFATVLFILFAVLGYFFFGKDTQDDIVLNISCENMKCMNMSVETAKLIGGIVKGFTTVMVLFNYPLTIFGAFLVIESVQFGPVNIDSFQGKNKSYFSIFVDWRRAVLRTLCISLTILIVVFETNFAFVTTLAGCFSGLMTFSLPTLFYYCLYRNVTGNRWLLVFNFLFFIGGIVVCVLGIVFVVLMKVNY